MRINIHFIFIIIKMRVMSDEDAKFKGDTLSKFKQEQSIRMGG